MYQVKMTEKSRLELATISLSVADLRILKPVITYGLPETLSRELRNVLQELVCRSASPIIRGWI